MCHVIIRNIWPSEKGQMTNNDLLLRKLKIKQLKDTKGVIRNRRSKDRQYNGKIQMSNDDVQALHRNLKIEQHELH